MAKSNPLDLLGLAQRAGRTIDGEERILKTFQTSQMKLVFLANDAGQNITKKIKDKCQYYQIPLIDTYSKSQLAQAISKARTVVAITDEGFVNTILKALNQ